MKDRLTSWLAGGFISLYLSSIAFGETVYLTSLDWPPYSGNELKNQGASVAVAKAAFQAMGHELVVEFYPWSRAVALAQNNAKYVGYFPEYFYESDDFLFSDSMGKGPLGFVESKAKPVSWANLSDLSPYTIGIVQGYVNTDELDTMIANGELKASAVVSDSQNILKVSTGRVALAVIDSNVLNYLLANDSSVRPAVGKVQMNANILVDKDLYVAFRNEASGQKWQDIYNQGLMKIDINAIMAEHM